MVPPDRKFYLTEGGKARCPCCETCLKSTPGSLAVRLRLAKMRRADKRLPKNAGMQATAMKHAVSAAIQIAGNDPRKPPRTMAARRHPDTRPVP